MNLNRYKKLCSLFDTILLSSSAPEIIANSYLHIVNTHPQSLKKYSFSRKLRIRVFIRSRLVTMFRLLQSILTPPPLLKNHNSDILFVSHLTNTSQQLQENDAYFGNLPSFLIKNNISSSIALINHIKTDIQISDAWKKSVVSRFILSDTLDFLSELKICISQKKSKRKLVKVLRDLNVNKLHAKNILNHHFSPDTYNAIRIAIQVACIVKKTGANFIITTYEGHAWERLVYYHVRKINPNIKCFGYQHAALSKHNYAIKRPLKDPFNPDVIFTSGVITQEVFRENRQIKSKITCLGSFKYLPYSIKKNTVKCCLVVPEGIFSECLLLFKFSLEYAIQHQNQKFIWRLHPILNFDILQKKNSFFKKLPDNIDISERSLDDDIKKCNSVLYRGSTSVLRAISGGLSPIYYKKSTDELSVDPIYNILDGKFIVCNTLDLYHALHKKVSAKQMLELQDFSINYFTPMNENSLLGFF